MIVTPGEQIIARVDRRKVSVEQGVYVVHSDNHASVSIRASRLGVLQSSVKRNNVGETVNEYKVMPQFNMQYDIPKVGQIVIGKVSSLSQRIATIQLQLAILENGTHSICYDGYQGLVRPHPNAENQQFAIPLYSCIRVGDIIRARVLAMGLYQTFYLDIHGESQLGVLRSWCPITKDPMNVIASDQQSILSCIQCPTCHHTEQRKCAVTSR